MIGPFFYFLAQGAFDCIKEQCIEQCAPEKRNRSRNLINHVGTNAIPSRPRESRIRLPSRVGNSQSLSGQPSGFSENSIQSQSKNEIFRNEKGGGSKMERCASKASSQENGTTVPIFQRFDRRPTHGITRGYSVPAVLGARFLFVL